MQKEVTLRVEESIYKQFMGFIRLNKKVEVVSTPLPTVKHSGRRMRSHLPVVKAFIYDFDEGGARLLMFCRGLMALGWIDQNTNIQTFIDLFLVVRSDSGSSGLATRTSWQNCSEDW